MFSFAGGDQPIPLEAICKELAKRGRMVIECHRAWLVSLPAQITRVLNVSPVVRSATAYSKYYLYFPGVFLYCVPVMYFALIFFRVRMPYY